MRDPRILNEKRIVSLINGIGKTRYSDAKKKKMKSYPYLISLTKINSKWIKNLDVRPETVKLLEENIGESSLTLVLAMIFLDMVPKAQETEVKINT